jgi:aminopeptidase
LPLQGLARLARILTGYSTPVKKGNIVCLEGSGQRSLPLIREIYRQCLKKGALMTEYRISYPELARDFFRLADPEQLGHFPDHRLQFLRECDVYIGVRAEENLMELASVPREKILARTKLLRPLADWRVNRTRWVVTRLPTEAMAQTAGLSKEELDEIYFRACLQNWREISKKQEALVDMLFSGRTLRLSGRRTDLTLDIEGMPVIKADGHRNMPDGEVFTAPRLKSAEGRIEFNCPSYFGGTKFSGIYLEFKKGKVVKARANTGQEDLAKIIRSDGGSSYLGEFAFGLNHGITRPTGNILFDEKMAGSIHLALGNSYEKCSNGNRSAIHWDLVRMMKKDGEVYLDGKLIQKKGLFTSPSLESLNSP